MPEKISVCIPIYNGEKTILQTIESVLTQTFQDFEVVIVDNASDDNTVNLIKSIKDVRIQLYKNKRNLGCGGNLNECIKRATGDILVYVCADDLLDVNALEKIYNAFQLSENIGVVLRPYYWFEEDCFKPVRITEQFDKNRIVSINDSFKLIRSVLSLSGQLSGVGFRKRYINDWFDSDPFIETASLVIKILKQNRVVILKDDIVAVRIGYSGSMSCSVYQKSPMLSWYNLIMRNFDEEKFGQLRRYLVKNFVANNYIGLVQIKNFGNYNFLFREIWYLLKFRWSNILNYKFWFFSIGTIIVPKILLKELVVVYKNRIHDKSFNKVVGITLNAPL